MAVVVNEIVEVVDISPVAGSSALLLEKVVVCVCMCVRCTWLSCLVMKRISFQDLLLPVMGNVSVPVLPPKYSKL